MAIGPRLDLRQSQSLVMTLQLQQAIKLLQLSNQELAAFVEGEIEQNPMLEHDEDEREAADIANNGQETVAAVQHRAYDLVLMDVQMPELDGLDATRQIRNLGANPHDFAEQNRPAPMPYIIAMTANAMQGDREMCLQAGMDDYLSKPIQVAELRAALEHWGAKARARAS